MQMLGDKFSPSEETPETTFSDTVLYHSYLKYKNNICDFVVTEIKKQRDSSFIRVGHYNDYPCIMVHISEETIHKAKKTKTPSSAAFEAWVDFLISYFVGLVNYAAYKNKIPLEIERRSGFGFFTPSIAPTGNSFRINIGLIPKIYAQLIVDALVELDKVLEKITDENAEIPEVSEEIFYGSDEHKAYVGKKYTLVELDDMLQLLWAKVEKGDAGKTTVQNIVRTPYARDSVAIEVFKQRNKKTKNQPIDAFWDRVALGC